MKGDPAELLRVLAPMEDVQVGFQIIHLSAITSMISLLHTLPRYVTGDTALQRPVVVGTGLHGREEWGGSRGAGQLGRGLDRP